MSLEPLRPLHGQMALVTGGSSGIRAAIARALGTAGTAVGVNYRSHPEQAEQIVEEIQERGGKAVALKADVSKEAEVQTMFDAFVGTFGRIDTLMANSGIQQDAPFTDMTLDQWRRVIDVNLTGQLLCAREAVRRFLAQGADTSVSRAWMKSSACPPFMRLSPGQGTSTTRHRRAASC